MPRGWGSPSTSKAVRDWLSKHGRGTAPEITKDLSERFEEMGYESLPDNESINRILGCADQLNLVEVVGTKEVKGVTRGIPRKVYRVIKDEVENPAWNNPCEALYDPSRFKRRFDMFR